MQTDATSHNIPACCCGFLVNNVVTCCVRLHGLSLLTVIFLSLFRPGPNDVYTVFTIPVGWFVRMETTTAHPMLTILFKNVLRTFESEILKNI